jgi:hypothetical protein
MTARLVQITGPRISAAETIILPAQVTART